MTMAARNWFRFLRNKFVKPSRKSIILVHNNTARLSEAASTIAEENVNIVSSPFQSPKRKESSIQDNAAIKIQATFRGHLARRAYSALRSLVKLQALVRGVRVRKQTHIALNCMHALVRLQVRVHARQLLSKCSSDDS